MVTIGAVIPVLQIVPFRRDDDLAGGGTASGRRSRADDSAHVTLVPTASQDPRQADGMVRSQSGERIVVGVDGSDGSVDALRYAGRLAAALDAPIDVITCAVDDDSGAHVAGQIATSGTDIDAASLARRAIAAAFGDAPPARVSITATRNAAANALVTGSEDASMLVVGGRGRGGFVGMLLGSVSRTVAEYARCPVLVVRPHSAPRAPATVGEPAEGGAVRDDRVLVGVDGSYASIAALQEAARIAPALHAPLDVLTSVTARMSYGETDVRPRLAQARSIVEDALERAFPGARPEGYRAWAFAGSPAARLIESSAHAGMLVVGRRGTGGFAGLLLGSVSAQCVAHAECPVLVVPAPAPRTDAPEIAEVEEHESWG